MFRLHTFDEVASTNSVIHDAIERGEDEGYVALARFQTQGYGRRGSFWASPTGGVYASFLLKPNKPDPEIATLGTIAAYSVTETLRSFLKANLRDRICIKWPNDVIAGSTSKRFLKICGISSEKIGDAVCLGIGVNVARSNEAMGTLELDERNRPVYLNDLLVTRQPSVKEVSDHLLQQFQDDYIAWKDSDFSRFHQRVNERSGLFGKHVEISTRDGVDSLRGTAMEIARDGALLLKLDSDESLKKVYEGSVLLI